MVVLWWPGVLEPLIQGRKTVSTSVVSEAKAEVTTGIVQILLPFSQPSHCSTVIPLYSLLCGHDLLYRRVYCACTDPHAVANSLLLRMNWSVILDGYTVCPLLCKCPI